MRKSEGITSDTKEKEPTELGPRKVVANGNDSAGKPPSTVKGGGFVKIKKKEKNGKWVSHLKAQNALFWVPLRFSLTRVEVNGRIIRKTVERVSEKRKVTKRKVPAYRSPCVRRGSPSNRTGWGS